MAGDSSKFIVEFQAEWKKVKAAISEMKRETSQTRQDTKKDRTQDKRFDREKDRDRVKVRKAEEKSRKEERKHVLGMQKEEQKRHKAALFAVQRIHNEQGRQMKKNASLERQLMRQGGGRGGAGPQGRGGAGGQGGKQGTGFWGGLGIGVGISNLLGGAFNMLYQSAQAGYQKYMEYGMAKSRSIGIVTGKQFKRGQRGAMGGKLGYSLTDTASQVPVMARATGEAGPRELQQAMRSTGMEAGEAGDIFGTMRRAGYSFAGAGKGKQSAGGREFQKLIAAGMASGLEKSRFPEFASGVQQIAEQNRMLTTGNVNMGEIAKQLSMWGRTTPGLQGAAGANLFGKVTGGIGAPGGGEWGESFMRQAAGFGKPGGTTGFYQAEKAREAGARGDPTMIMNVMKEFKNQFGGFGGAGKEESALAMRETLGVTLDQAETLQKIYQSSETAEEQQKQIAKVMEGAGSLEQQSLKAMEGLGGTAKRIAELTNRGIDMGAKSAKIIEEMEDLQYKALMMLVKGIETLTGYVKDIRDFFNIGANKGKQAEDLKKTLSDEPLSKDPMKRREQLAKRRELAIALQEEGGATGDMARKVMTDNANEMNRKKMINEARRKHGVDLKKPLSMIEQDFLETGENEGLLSMTQGKGFDIVGMDKPAPAGMKHKKGKSSATHVAPEAAAAPVPSGDAGGATPFKIVGEFKLTETPVDPRSTPKTAKAQVPGQTSEPAHR